MCKRLQLLTQVVFFAEIHVFLQLSWIGRFRSTRAYLHLETPKLQKVFLSKPFSQGNNVLDLVAYTIDGFPWRFTCVLQLSWLWLFAANRDYLQLEHESWRKYSFQKLTQFSQLNNMLDVPAANTDSFLSRDTCVSSTLLKRPIWNKMSHSPAWELDLQEVFLSKNNSVLKGKQCARCSCF
jgi:hypothetical protein